MLYVPCSHGEALDKLTILEIKQQRVLDPESARHISKERQLLGDICKDILSSSSHDVVSTYDRLKCINQQLWDIEDQVRELEAANEFGDPFMRAARMVYTLNDRRAALKKELNVVTNSGLMEVKSHDIGGEMPLLILPHLGMGDLIVCAGLVNNICTSRASSNIIIPCKQIYYQSTSQLFSHNKNLRVLPISDGVHLQHIIDHKNPEIIALGYRNMTRNMKEWESIHECFIYRFYIEIGLPPTLSWSHFTLHRRRDVEEALYDEVVKSLSSSRYVFVHQDPSRTEPVLLDPAKLPKDVAVFYADDPSVRSSNIFDYCTVLERAQAVHAFDSCFAHLADRLCDSHGELVVHAYAPLRSVSVHQYSRARILHE